MAATRARRRFPALAGGLGLILGIVFGAAPTAGAEGLRALAADRAATSGRPDLVAETPEEAEEAPEADSADTGGPAAEGEAADGAAQGGFVIEFVDPESDEADAADEPASPFGRATSAVRRDAVPGYVELSTGLKVPGRIYTTRGRRLKVFNLGRRVNEYVPVPAVKRIETDVEWERIDREWRFKEAGNPEKVYSGRTYPARMLRYRIILRNDHSIEGHILGQPLYVRLADGSARRFVLHKRQKGPMGSALEELVYVAGVALGEDACAAAVAELKARAAAADEGRGGDADPVGPAPGPDAPESGEPEASAGGPEPSSREPRSPFAPAAD